MQKRKHCSDKRMMKFLKKINFKIKQKGMLSVEASIIFPLILFVLFSIIYLTILHYQNNVMIAESIRAMNRVGAYWQYVDMDIEGKPTKYKDDTTVSPPFDSTIPANGIINIDMIKNRCPYRTIIDVVGRGLALFFGKPIGYKVINAQQYVKSKIAGVKFKQYTKDSDTIVNEVKNGGFMFFGDDLKVDISKKYSNPIFEFSKKFLGTNSIMKKTMNKDITVSGVISNQIEFIRNIDTVYDIGSSALKLQRVK